MKNTPFVIKVTITNSLYDGSIWDFNRLTLDASLLYDCWEEKPVPYLKNKPIQYHGKVNDTADTMTLNTKINVLSSHCENMMFRGKQYFSVFNFIYIYIIFPTFILTMLINYSPGYFLTNH